MCFLFLKSHQSPMMQFMDYYQSTRLSLHCVSNVRCSLSALSTSVPLSPSHQFLILPSGIYGSFITLFRKSHLFLQHFKFHLSMDLKVLNIGLTRFCESTQWKFRLFQCSSYSMPCECEVCPLLCGGELLFSSGAPSRKTANQEIITSVQVQ